MSQGKPIKMTGRRVAYAIDKLTKNTLADIVIDRIKAEIGEDASDEQIVAVLQRWLHPVAIVRGDKEPNLSGLMEQLDRFDTKYIKEHQ